MRHLALETPLFEALGARAPYLRRLEKLGIHTVGELLWHFPSRYDDFSKVYGIAELEPGQQATVQAAVEEVNVRRTRRGLSIVEALIADESGTIRAVWFNQPYVANTLRAGRVANFAGKVSLSEEGEMFLSHPLYEIMRAPASPAFSASEDGPVAQETRHTARLIPIYPETRGLTSRGLRFIMRDMLKRAPELKEWIPAETLNELGFPEINTALQTIHFPNEIEAANVAARRFSFEHLFLLQLFNLQQKSKLAQEKASALAADIEKIKLILAELPFELTPSQKRSLWEIIKDVEKPRPMNRLLQGDVGSGKTVVAAIAAILATENGLQAAFMAPTEILTRQHFATMKNLLVRIAAHSKPVIGLLTGSEAIVSYEDGMDSKLSKDAFNEKVASGEIQIIFGTHALIQKSVAFKNLGLVIVDEQHRFGVRQRAELISRKKGGVVPHFLSMSATPIPRTLMLSVFGDLDISLITEMPAGRKIVETKIVSPIERQATYEFIRNEIKSGRQAFVICPRIEPSKEDEAGALDGAMKDQRKKLEVKSVLEEYERLSKKIFPDLRVAMLHGQMKPKEKEDVMKKFKNGDIDMLVSTSVVEVGVDIPNATVMMIEGVERFGLAQIYQFRGRVGRGEYQSYCFLMTDSTSESVAARMKAILEAKNGFELAEKDLELRGPGQFFGDIQTGFPDEAMRALQDPELVKMSREAAIKLVSADRTFSNNAPLKKRLEDFKKNIHQE